MHNAYPSVNAPKEMASIHILHIPLPTMALGSFLRLFLGASKCSTPDWWTPGSSRPPALLPFRSFPFEEILPQFCKRFFVT
jgi:hypothetical protein